MTELRNFTPFANLQFANWDAAGREFGVYMVKTAWDILPDGSCKLSDEQEPFAFTDQFHGEPNLSSVRYASDFVPYKPMADIVLDATGFAPGGQPHTGFSIGVGIADQGGQVLLRKALFLSGPRRWVRHRGGWSLTEPEPVNRLDIRYEHAYGGCFRAGTDGHETEVVEAFEFNPIGVGFADPNRSASSEDLPAPQILGEQRAPADPFERLEPAGYGPIQASWLPRRPLGGTYDRHWEENVWPLWPADYDFAFHNAASHGMRVPLFRATELRCRLIRLHPEIGEWHITLPDPRLEATVLEGHKIRRSGLWTDTVHFDISGDRLADPRIFMVSRLVFDRTRTDAIVLSQLREDENQHKLAPPPSPDQVARFAPEESVAVTAEAS